MRKLLFVVSMIVLGLSTACGDVKYAGTDLPPGQCFHVSDADHVVTILDCHTGRIYRQVQPQERMVISGDK